jgi:predicted anti-sigma-YlaC factor YlaD
MICRECQELVQVYLDGDSLGPAKAEVRRHLAACPDCRELYAAAQRLKAGLQWFAPAVPPLGLAKRIETRILTQTKRVRSLRQFAASLAVAASLLVAVLLAYHFMKRSGPPVDGQADLQAQNPAIVPPSSPSLHRSVEEASEAVVSLTRRATDETIEQGRLLLPVVLPGQGLAELREPLPAPRPPDQSLRDLQQGMAAGLEPVTTSARRAVDLFLREIPPMGAERKEGL